MLKIYRSNKRIDFEELNIASEKDCIEGLKRIGIERKEINLADLEELGIILKSY